VGVTTLVGGLVFRHLIVRPTLLSHQEFENFTRHFRRVEAGSIMLVAVTSVGYLILRTLMMSGTTLVDLGVALPVVLRQTHFGAVWIARLSLVGLLAMPWLLRRAGAQGLSWSLGPSLLGATLIALTTSLWGHSADWGDLTLPVLIDWFHLLAVSTWIGGLFTFGFVLHASLSPPPKAASHGLASIALRFSGMGVCCAVIFLASGLYNSWLQVTSISRLFTTSYGQTLLVKLSLVLLVLMIAALNRYYFVSRLGRSVGAHDGLIFKIIGRFASTLLTSREGKDDEKIRQQFFRFIRLEWVVAAGALACTALLAQLPPARHIRSHQHREQHAIPRLPQGPATAKRVAGGEKALIEMNSSLFLERAQ
jgi:putative copper export protein